MYSTDGHCLYFPNLIGLYICPFFFPFSMQRKQLIQSQIPNSCIYWHLTFPFFTASSAFVLTVQNAQIPSKIILRRIVADVCVWNEVYLQPMYS